MRKRSLLFLAALITAAAVAATMYKWVDEKGVTHYSDAPPPNQKSQRLDTQAAPPPTSTEGATPPGESWQKKEEEFKQRHKARQQQLDEDIKKRQREWEWGEIQRGARTPVPGETGAAPALQRDVLQLMVTMDSGADPACTDHKVINTEWLETNRETRTAVERWTLDRCGKKVGYRVTFMPAPQGGTNFSVKAE